VRKVGKVKKLANCDKDNVEGTRDSLIGELDIERCLT
jgi:hypothetical protein